MQSRVGSLGSLEEGKDSSVRVAVQHRLVPLRLLQFFLLVFGVGILLSILSLYIRYFNVQSELSMPLSRVQPCLEESKSLTSLIRPPGSLFHSMNDTELFWRASFVPQIKEYPYHRTPKIAFMFLTRGPLPLAPLWERFFNGKEGLYNIYIHSSPSYEPDFQPSSVFYRRNIPSQEVNWGKVNVFDAERRLLANALLDISNEWFVLLSESCIPLNNFSIIYRYISRSRYSFVDVFDDPGKSGRGRYDQNMSPEINITQWRKGSQWVEVNRKLAIDIIEDDFYYPKFRQFCRPECYVDEHYFPTMLSIQSPHLLANRSITWVDWSQFGAAHPATFGKYDVTEQFFKKNFEGNTCNYNNQLSSLCYLFARKFAPNALDPLLEHSALYLGF